MGPFRILCYVAPMPEEITRSHCNRCGSNTYHDVLALSSNEEEFKADELALWLDRYEILKCRGCGEVSFRYTSSFDGEYEPTVICYPPAIARQKPDWMRDLFLRFRGDYDKENPPPTVPDKIRGIMDEVYIALQNDSRRLCAMGIRATLERVMIDKVGDHGLFIKNLDEFEKVGYLSARQRTVLDTILDAGHASIHRGWEPTKDDIRTLLDITESVIESVYLHEASAERLEKTVPKRLPKANKP